ncbi:molybdenum cofactor biosynthesis protein MoaE [Spongiivirga sp. MCCC 1A20706]|uniref:molybdenum cofactor biosynthesis protein MoaE n=1 Tax=Spongiivirga sp. MCCC 1A20706 TaxID=3160963 RepID=UPI003977CE3A
MMSIEIKIVDNIDTAIAYKQLSHPKSGGVCVFIGSVRNVTQNETVEALDFEAYEKMALKEMQSIAKEATEKWELNKVLMHHVVGKKLIEEPVVMVGASSAHRNPCFEACRYLIDTLKERVPIWKKEFFENKTVWVSSTP